MGPFSTFDNDNDNRSDEDCARQHRGGWWFHECYHRGCFLTGSHTATARYIWDKINWYNGTAYTYFPNAEIKIRRKSCPKQTPPEKC